VEKREKGRGRGSEVFKAGSYMATDASKTWLSQIGNNCICIVTSQPRRYTIEMHASAIISQPDVSRMP